MRLNKSLASFVAAVVITGTAAAQSFGQTIVDFGNNIVAPGGERLIPFFMTITPDEAFFNSEPGARRWANFALRFKYDASKIDLLVGNVRASTMSDGSCFCWFPVLQPGVNGLGAFQKKTEAGKIVIEIGIGNASNNNTLLAGHFFGTEDDTGHFVPFRWIVKTNNFAHQETYLIETSVAGAGRMAKVSPTRTSAFVLQGRFTVPEPGSWIALMVGLGSLASVCRRRK
jgi:hypothetical protein